MTTQNKQLVFVGVSGLVFGSWAGQLWGDSQEFIITRVVLSAICLTSLAWDAINYLKKQ